MFMHGEQPNFWCCILVQQKCYLYRSNYGNHLCALESSSCVRPTPNFEVNFFGQKWCVSCASDKNIPKRKRSSQASGFFRPDRNPVDGYLCALEVSFSVSSLQPLQPSCFLGGVVAPSGGTSSFFTHSRWCMSLARDTMDSHEDLKFDLRLIWLFLVGRGWNVFFVLHPQSLHWPGTQRGPTPRYGLVCACSTPKFHDTTTRSTNSDLKCLGYLKAQHHELRSLFIPVFVKSCWSVSSTVVVMFCSPWFQRLDLIQ